jgi:hypothetical protein
MTSKHKSVDTDAWARQFKPGIRMREGDWLPNPLSGEERRARLARFVDRAQGNVALFPGATSRNGGEP